MQLLLDTHIYLWAITNDIKLSKTAKDLMQDASEIYISSASIWEIAIKTKLGKLKLDIEMDELTNCIIDSGFKELPITMKHATQISQLPDLHRDPFDRMLIAQAITEPLRLLTADQQLKGYSELVLNV